MTRALLTAAQQARIAGFVSEYLPSTVTVSVVRLVRTKDGAGGFKSTLQAIQSAIQALIIPYLGRSGGIEMIQNERFEQTMLWKISIPAGIDVLAADRIQDSTGREWEVKSVAAPLSLEVMRELYCIERLSG